jgi:membrane fusion protein (multidrug efflux system)
MARRMALMLLVVGAFVTTIGFVKYRQVRAGAAQSGSFQPPPEAVTTIVAREETWRATLAAIGTVAAVNGVEVSADLPGIVHRIAFVSGGRVDEGAVLVELDTRQEQAQLRAAQARLDLARLNFDRIHGLREQGITSQADHDAAQAELAQADAVVGEIRATIERKTIRAPFAGVLGIRQINLGQYLKEGDPVVPLQALDPIHVNFSVPQQEIRRLRAGAEVRVAGEGLTGEERAGRVTAIDSIVDDATRNVQVQATLANPGARLHPGMFVNATILLDAREPVVALPGSAVSYAPYGDSVYIVEDLKGPDGKTYRGVRQQFVKLGAARGDQIAVLSGIAAGAEVVTSGVFKLRNGAAVLVNNDVQPANAPSPTVADN